MGINVGDIIQGHVNELLDLNEDMSENRMRICRKCPIFKKDFGGICNHQLWLNPETNDISLVKKEGYRRGCGCRLLAKTTLANAACPAGKW